MTRHPLGVCVARWIAAILVLVSVGIASAETPPPYVFSGPLLPLLLQMPREFLAARERESVQQCLDAP